MAPQPTPPHTPTTTTPTPSPPLTAAQARALLQTLRSTVDNPGASTPLPNTPNPGAPRPLPNTTTPNNALNCSSPTPRNPWPSPFPTITIDASTRIIGHANQIRFPHDTVHGASRIEGVMRAALAHTATSHQSAKPVNLTIQTGITLSGTRNIVDFGAGGSDDKNDATLKNLGTARQGIESVGGASNVCPEAGRKRRAESEPVGEVRGKKVKVEKEV